MRFTGHIVRKNSIAKRLIQRKGECKRRRGRPGRPAKTWLQDKVGHDRCIPTGDCMVGKGDVH